MMRDLREDGKGHMGDSQSGERQIGDDQEGSSGAAHGAQDADEAGQSKGGFFSRVIGALSPSDADDSPAVLEPGYVNGSRHEAMPGMLNLRQMRIEDVMVPKSEIVSVPVDASKAELVELFRDSGLTRLPVFDGTLDTPVGLVHLKDFALTHGFVPTGEGPGGTAAQPFVLKDLLRPLLYAPPSMPLGVLLQKMQANRIHMALVIDEYGGVDGLVTIEDLIEQVVGEIEDEHDAEEGPLWVQEKPGLYLAEAKTPLEEFEAETGHQLHINQDDEEIDTLGGLVFLLSGHVPARGEVIQHPEGPEFEVVDADPRRIKRLRVRIPTAMAG